MSRETAVTKEISYNTTSCDVCGQQAVVDRSAPDDTIEPHSYAVVLGEGEFTQESADEANWSNELRFELDKNKNNLPTVEGRRICSDCAQSIHKYPASARNYSGQIPSEIDSYAISNINISQKQSIILVLIAFVFILMIVFI